MGSTRLLGRAALLWTVIFSAAFVVLPLASIFSVSPGVGSGLFEPDVLAVAGATLRQALWSAALSLALGLPLGLWIGSLAHTRTGRAGMLALLLPFGVPTIVASSAWVAWLGRSGIFAGLGLGSEWIYSFKAVILAHVFLNAPWVALLVAHTRADVPEDEIAAARLLGAGFWGVLSAVTWPRVRRSLVSSGAQVFSLCVASFAIVMILGGGPPVETLETAIFSSLKTGGINPAGAAALAIWQLALTAAPWILILILDTRKSAPTRAMSGALKPTRENSRLGLGAFSFCMIWMLPYFAILNPGFIGAALSEDAGSSLLSAAFFSLELALATATLAVVNASAALLAYRLGGRWARIVAGFAAVLPSGISALVLGLGFWTRYQSSVDLFGGSFWLIVTLQATLFTPVAFRVLWPAAAEVQSRQLEAALTLGATLRQAFFAVEWPRLRGPVTAAFALVAGASLGELGAVSLFSGEGRVPLSLLISRWMGQYRFTEAQGASALLLCAAVAVMLAGARTSLERTP